MIQRIVVTGGTGYLGQAVCERLVAAFPGVKLVVPTRRLDAGSRIATLPGVELVRCDVHDAAQIAPLMRASDALVQLVAILHGSASDFDRVHVQLQKTLATAAKAAGVARVVQVSALGVSADAPSDYLRSKAGGEAVWRSSGLPVAILRPSVIFGRDDRFTNLFASLQKLAPVMPLAGATAQMQPVWQGDVAQAVVAVLQRPPAADPIVECAGPEVLTLAQVVQRVGAMAGRQRPIVPLPDGVARLQVAMLSLKPGAPLMSADNLRSLQVPNVASGRHPGLAALGISPSGLDCLAEHFAPQPAYRR